MRVGTLAFLFAPLSVALAIGQPHPLFLKPSLFPAGSCSLKVSSGNQTGRVLFRLFYSIMAQAAQTRLTGRFPNHGSCRKACATVFETWLRISLFIPPRTRPFSRPRAVHARHLRQEEAAKGKEARQHLQFILATTDHLDDVIAGLAFLKTIPGIDPKRLAIVGHSFGGQLTLLAAERDNTIRAAVTVSAAAGTWERSPELRKRLQTAVDKSTAPDHADSGRQRLPHRAKLRIDR